MRSIHLIRHIRLIRFSAVDQMVAAAPGATRYYDAAGANEPGDGVCTTVSRNVQRASNSGSMSCLSCVRWWSSTSPSNVRCIDDINDCFELRVAPLNTFHAFKRCAQESCATRFCYDPRPVLPWRVVPNMLRVTTFQIGHPVLLFVLMKPENATRNGGSRTWVTTHGTLTDLQMQHTRVRARGGKATSSGISWCSGGCIGF